MSEREHPDIEAIAAWVVASRPLFADRILWERSDEMLAVRRRLMAEYERANPPAPAGSER